MNDSLSKCELCPRRCGVNRLAGEKGFCKAGAETEIYRWGPHHGEEPPISGRRGSGTVFFSRCTLRCVYCQNFPWSQEGKGRKYSAGELVEAFRGLKGAGCHNWNLVSPTPWLPMIAAAVGKLKDEGVSLPVVYNTSGFENVETLAGFADLTDIYLTDLRYSRRESALSGSGSADYVDAARAAFSEMWRQRGPLKVDGGGAAVSGVICRLLILPGRAVEAVENLRWLADNVGTNVAVSVMSQYLPAHKAVGMNEWNRRISREEYRAVCKAVDELGFSEGWTQDYELTAPNELVGFRMKSGAHNQQNGADT